MRQSPQIDGQLSKKCRTCDRREEKADRIAAFLRSRYPAKTAEFVAADLGVPAETIQKMLSRHALPNVATYGRMIFAYGPAFLVAVYPCRPQWISDAYQREQIAQLEVEQARIQSKIQALKAQK